MINSLLFGQYSVQQKLYLLEARSSNHCSWLGTYISAGMRSNPGDSGDPRSFVLLAETEEKKLDANLHFYIFEFAHDPYRMNSNGSISILRKSEFILLHFGFSYKIFTEFFLSLIFETKHQILRLNVFFFKNLNRRISEIQNVKSKLRIDSWRIKFLWIFLYRLNFKRA